MKKFSLFLLVLATIIASCAKETIFLDANGNPASGPVAVVGLSGTSWRLTSSTSKIEFDPSTIIDFDLFTASAACSKDNILTFKTNSRMSSDEGPTKCSASDPQVTDIGSWKLSADKKTLVLDQLSSASYGVPTLNSEVLQFDDKILTIRYITYINGPKATTTQSYIRVN